MGTSSNDSSARAWGGSSTLGAASVDSRPPWATASNGSGLTSPLVSSLVVRIVL